MNNILLAILIIFGVIGLIILYRILKPYFIKYNTTLLITGELGAGKTLTAVKTAQVLIRKMRFKVNFYNKIKRPIINKWRKHKNKKLQKNNLDPIPLLEKKRKPQLISNMPIHFKPKFFNKKREWSVKLTAEMILLIEKMPEYSIFLIDEMPQLVNQFNWDEELVQKNLNEFITFFRHYYGSHLIMTSQSTSDIVVQVRRKCNQAVWCYHMWKAPFKLFYTIRMCDMMLNDNIQTMTNTYIEENTRLHFGLFPKKGTYDSRCYSERIKNAYIEKQRFTRWNKLKTNEIIRMEEYISPLDDKTTNTQKKYMLKHIESLKSIKEQKE